jgi:hypothetical protein
VENASFNWTPGKSNDRRQFSAHCPQSAKVTRALVIPMTERNGNSLRCPKLVSSQDITA